jgi:hypothetical protein
VSEEPVVFVNRDDEDDPEVVKRAYEVLAERNLERRNRDVGARGGELVTGPARRRAWIAEDIKRSGQLLGAVTRNYLSYDPTLRVDELVDLLDSDAANAVAESPLLEDPT